MQLSPDESDIKCSARARPTDAERFKGRLREGERRMLLRAGETLKSTVVDETPSRSATPALRWFRQQKVLVPPNSQRTDWKAGQ